MSDSCLCGADTFSAGFEILLTQKKRCFQKSWVKEQELNQWGHTIHPRSIYEWGQELQHGIRETVISVQKDAASDIYRVLKPLSSHTIIACSMATTREPSYSIQNWAKNMLHCPRFLAFTLPKPQQQRLLERDRKEGVENLCLTLSEGAEWVESVTCLQDQSFQAAKGQRLETRKSAWNTYFTDAPCVWCLSQLYTRHCSAFGMFSLGLKGHHLPVFMEGQMQGSLASFVGSNGEVALMFLLLCLASGILNEMVSLGGLLVSCMF